MLHRCPLCCAADIATAVRIETTDQRTRGPTERSGADHASGGEEQQQLQIQWSRSVASQVTTERTDQKT